MAVVPELTTLMLGTQRHFGRGDGYAPRNKSALKGRDHRYAQLSAEAFTALPFSAVTPAGEMEAFSGPVSVTSLRIW